MRNPAAIWLFASAAALGAEVIDRIAVTLGQQAITASDLDREIRVAAFLNRTRPDFSPASKRKIADRMVEQRLVRRELELTRFPSPAPSEAEPALQKFQAEHFPDPALWARSLAEAGVTEAEVRDHILWQIALLRFIDMRFRPGVQVAEADIAEYFEKQVRSAAPPGAPSASFDDHRARIHEILAERQVDRDLDAWIAEARKRVGVVYRKEVFEP